MKLRYQSILLGAAFVLLAATLAAQQRAQQPEQPAKPQQAPAEASYDPYHAQKAVEIGQFYMKKGDYDAAIDRFHEAIRLRSNFALPRELLGEAYEKKGDKFEAMKYYTEYLSILPKAPDAAKVRKKIEKLSRELSEKKAGR